MPGNFRRFIPNSGSGYTFCFTSAATTVVGTLTEYHPVGTNFDVEISSPSFSTLHEDCNDQPSRSVMVFSPRDDLASGFGAGCATRNCENSSRTTAASVVQCFFMVPFGSSNSAKHSYHALLIRFNSGI